jgi:hypothetical protein
MCVQKCRVRIGAVIFCEIIEILTCEHGISVLIWV